MKSVKKATSCFFDVVVGPKLLSMILSVIFTI